MPVDAADCWALTIVRAQGADRLHPEKDKWRPLITIGLDDNLLAEVQLCSDGKNPNLRRPVHIDAVRPGAKLVFRVYYQRPTKKTSSAARKAQHVGAAEVSISHLSKRFGSDIKTEIPIFRNVQSRVIPRRERGQRRPCLHIHLRAPNATAVSLSAEADEELRYLSEAGVSDPEYLSDLPPSTSPSQPTFESVPAAPEAGPSILRRRRRRGGYSLFSDESDLTDGAASEPEPFPPAYDDLSPIAESPCPPDSVDCASEDDGPGFTSAPWQTTLPGPAGWIAASLLPRYVDQISVASSRSAAESVLDAFTPYLELSAADEEGSEVAFARVLDRLRMEWYGVGGCLIALAGLNAAVFGFSDESLFTIDELGIKCVALSSVASGLGLFFISVFMVKYAFADVRRFQRRALDVYGTYAFFSLSCRLPTLCMAVSATALMGLLIGIAWRAWRAAVLAMCFLSGVLFSLQYLVFGVHWAARLLIRAVRGARRIVLGAVAPLPVRDADGDATVEPAVVVIPPSDGLRGSDMGPAGPRCVIAEALAQSPVQVPVELPAEAQDEDVDERDVAES